jgi:hypothetical protein
LKIVVVELLVVEVELIIPEAVMAVNSNHYIGDYIENNIADCIVQNYLDIELLEIGI